MVKKLAALLSVLMLVMVLSGCGKKAWPDNAQIAEMAVMGELIPASEDMPTYPDTSNTVFRMFFDNTNSMRGFVNPTIGNQKKTAFVYSVDDAINVALQMLQAKDNGFRQTEGYILKADEKNILRWSEVDLNDELQAAFCSTRFGTTFYTGSEGRPGTLTENGVSVGPLSRLFRVGNIQGKEASATPFIDDGLTVIVSDLMEQGFNLDVIFQGIQTYFGQNPYAAAAVIGCSSEYKGNLSIPMFDGTGVSEITVHDYTGDAGYYFVIVGPVRLVEVYVENLEALLRKDHVENSTVIFRNCQDTQSVVSALSFEAVPDTMKNVSTKNLKDYYQDDVTNVLGSANTEGTVNAVSYKNIIVGNIDGNPSTAMGDIFQLAAMADVQKEASYALGIARLYALTEYSEDKEGTVSYAWTEYTGNELESLHVRGEIMKGEKCDWDKDGDPVIVIPEGKEVFYVRCSMEFKKGAVKDEAGVYCVVVPYVGTKAGASQTEALRELEKRSISQGDLDKALAVLEKRGGGYQWSEANADANVKKALCSTPNLVNLLNPLNNSAFESEQGAHYLTFIFDMQNR